jgi:hypothetical protein
MSILTFILFLLLYALIAVLVIELICYILAPISRDSWKSQTTPLRHCRRNPTYLRPPIRPRNTNTPTSMKQTLSILTAALVAVGSFCLGGCGSAQSLASSKLAQDTVASVARYYGGADAGALAAAGLSATADVMQGYVDKKPPLQVAANSPGVQGVSQIAVEYLKKQGWVTQATVDNIHSAAQIAERATVSTVKEGP